MKAWPRNTKFGISANNGTLFLSLFGYAISLPWFKKDYGTIAWFSGWGYLAIYQKLLIGKAEVVSCWQKFSSKAEWAIPIKVWQEIDGKDVKLELNIVTNIYDHQWIPGLKIKRRFLNITFEEPMKLSSGRIVHMLCPSIKDDNWRSVLIQALSEL